MTAYEHIDSEKCNESARMAGRAAHMCRNYLQGFTNLEHPELQAVDGLMGQIEGQFRTLRSNLTERKDVKPQIKLIAKSGRFILKILDPAFIEDSVLGSSDLTELRELAEMVNQLTLCIDQEINIAILKESSKLFKIDLPKIATNSPNLPNVLSTFDSAVPETLKKPDQKFSPDERKANILKLSSMLSNRAHSIQDIVAEHIQNPTQKDHANHIINLAGAIENESRAIIAHFNSQPNPNLQNVQKNMAGISDSVTKIRQFVEIDTFLIKSKKDPVVTVCEAEQAIVEILKVVLAGSQ
jgi:hypothetical protein